MKVIHTQRIADEKVNQLKEGLTAFAETEEVIRLVKRRIDRNNLVVHEEHTNLGCWFTPEPLRKAQ